LYRGGVVAFLLLRVRPGFEREVRDAILERFGGNVTEAWITYGEYDIVVRVEAASQRQLDAVIRGVRRIRGVESLVTLLAA